MATTIPDTQLESIFAAAADLRVLRLRRPTNTDNALCVVGKYCKRLEVLVFSDTDIPPTGLDVASAALAYGCPLLRVVLMDKDSAVPPAARRLWNRVRPQLRSQPEYNMCN